MAHVVLAQEDYPKTLKIGKAIYSVIFVNKMPDALGACDDTNKIILISKDQSPEEALATCLHEILHAIEHEYKLKLGHPIIRKMEYPLAEVLAQFYLK